MAKSKKESFFWTSYSDLMTSLFFVMLVLFVLTVSLLQNKIIEIEKTKDDIVVLKDSIQGKLDKINELNQSIQKIDKEYFEYDNQFAI